MHRTAALLFWIAVALAPSQQYAQPEKGPKANEKDASKDQTSAATRIVKADIGTSVAKEAPQATKQKQQDSADAPANVINTFIAFFTGGLFVVAVIQLGMFRRQLDAMNASMADTKAAADAAKKAADVAERSLTALERPYLFVSVIPDLNFFDAGSPTWPDTNPVVNYTIKNHGRLPSFIDEICAEMFWTLYEAPPRNPAIDFHRNPDDPTVIFSGEESKKRPCLGSPQPKIGVAEKLVTENVFVWIKVKYRGPFTVDHESSFCWKVDGRKLFAFGGAKYNYTK